MQALAAVINIFLPRLIGSADKVADILNRQFLPVHECVDNPVCNAVYILWSRTILYQINREKSYSHFVPLIQSHFSPVKASAPNTSSGSDPVLTSPIKKQTAQKKAQTMTVIL